MEGDKGDLGRDLRRGLWSGFIDRVMVGSRGAGAGVGGVRGDRR